MFIINEREIVLIVKVSIILLTVVLNSHIIFVFYKISRKNSSFSDLIYLSIGISEFMIAGLTMSTQVISEESSFDWSRSHPLVCLFSIFAQYAIPDTTILSLLSLAIHIHFQLIPSSPSISSSFSPRRSLTGHRFALLDFVKLLLPWAITSIFWLGSLFYLAVYANAIDFSRCIIFPSIQFKVVKVIVFGFLPLIAIVTLNLMSIRRLNKRLKRFSLKVMKPIRGGDITESHISSEIGGIGGGGVSTIVNQKIHKIDFHFGVERRKRRNIKLDAYTKRNKKAINCILALTLSIIFTQSLYLITWPIFTSRTDGNDHHMVRLFYILGVWLSYLTSLFNPILLCLFNSKVRAQSREIFDAILGKFFYLFRLFY